MFVEGQAAIQEVLCPSTYTAAGVPSTSWPNSETGGVFGDQIDVSRFSALRIYLRCSTTGAQSLMGVYLYFDSQPFQFSRGDWTNDQLVITIPVYGRMFSMTFFHQMTVGSVNYRVEGIYQPLAQRTNVVPNKGAGDNHNWSVYGDPDAACGAVSLSGTANSTPLTVYLPSPNASRAVLVWTASNNAYLSSTYYTAQLFNATGLPITTLSLTATMTKQTATSLDFYTIGVHRVLLTPVPGYTMTYSLELRGLA